MPCIQITYLSYSLWTNYTEFENSSVNLKMTYLIYMVYIFYEHNLLFLHLLDLHFESFALGYFFDYLDHKLIIEYHPYLLEFLTHQEFFPHHLLGVMPPRTLH